MPSIQTNAPQGENKTNWTRKALGRVFTRNNIVNVCTVGLLADLFFNAGNAGASILDSNSYTNTGTAYYHGLGRFLTGQVNEFYSHYVVGLNDIVQREYRR